MHLKKIRKPKFLPKKKIRHFRPPKAKNKEPKKSAGKKIRRARAQNRGFGFGHGKKNSRLSRILRPKNPLNPAILVPKVPKMGHFGAKNAKKNKEACPEHGGGSASSVDWASWRAASYPSSLRSLLSLA